MYPHVGNHAGENGRYRRRQPEHTVLYRVVAAHLESFLLAIESDPTRTLPRFVVKELRAFLVCGVLAWG